MPADQALRKARSLARAGNFREAETLYRSVLDRFPANRRAQEELQALGGQGAVPAKDGPTRESVERLLGLFQKSQFEIVFSEARALAGRHPGVAILHALAGSAAAELDLKDEAIDALERAIAIDPTLVSARNALGAVLTNAGASERAIAQLTEALRIQPGYAEAHNSLGLAFAALGRKEEAVAALTRAIDLKPGYAAAHRHLAGLKTFAPQDPQIATMERLLMTIPASSGEAVHLRFALGKAFDDIGDSNAAFGHFAAGNRIRKKSEAGDTVGRTRAAFDTIRRLFDETSIVPAASEPRQDRRFVFIVGMPRSGTTLVEQILASHSQVYGAGELPFLGRAASRAMADAANARPGDMPAAFSNVREAYEKAIDGLGVAAPVITDKMPTNFQWAGFAAAAFPGAVILHTVRDPVATCWSIYRHYFPSRALDFAWDLDDLAGYYRLYRDLMAYWHERFPGRIHDLGYEALTENPTVETRRLLDICGLPFEPACLEPHVSARVVNTASAQQVRQKIYTGSSDAWRAYEAHLGPLLTLRD